MNEAAERLRRSKTECVYGVDSRGALKRQVDIATVINAYLAEHLCDDDEPITEEWLDETFDSREYGCQSWSLDEICNVYGWIDGYAFTVKRDDPNALISDITTRGQLRQLLRALGATP